MSAREESSIRLVLTLAIAGLFSGLVLVGVFLLTQPRILQNQAEALMRAVFRVLPGTERVETIVMRGDALTVWDGPEGQLPDEPAIYAGYDEAGSLIGYAIPADGPGFMDTIKLIYGYDPSRRVIIGMQVLDSRETPGLGDKIIADPDFHANFVALAIDPGIEAIKGERQNDNEVDCITGATISSEAVVGILNRSSTDWAPRLTPEDRPTEVTHHVRGNEP